MKRLDYIDLAKGVMILLVVAGHIVQYYLQGDVQYKLWTFIYSFHMPLFFLLSGFVTGLTQWKLIEASFIKWLWKKTRTLLVPFLLWSFLVYPFIDSVDKQILSMDFIFGMFESPSGAWFLISLFCIQVVCYPIIRYKRWYLWILLVIILIASHFVFDSFHYNNYYHYASYLAGFLLYEYRDRLIVPLLTALSVLVFIAAEVVYPNPILCTLSGGLALIYLSKCLLEKYASGGDILRLTLLGKNTMAIYLIHTYLIYSISGPYFEINDFRTTPVFLLILTLSYVVSILCVGIAKIMELVPYIGPLLLGKSWARI